MEKNSFFLIIIVAVMVMINGCKKVDSDEKPVAGVQSFILNLAQISELEEKANAGDSDAALRLHQYYEFVKNDRSSSLHWLEIGAKNNNVVCQYNLGKIYAEDEKLRDLEKARFWLKKAVENGDVDAKRALGSLPTQ